MIRIRALAPSLLFTLLAAAPCVSAQQASLVRGRVLDVDSRQPISAATVTIVDSSGTAISASMTDEAGSFLLAVLDAGTYRLRAERIGYRSAEQGPLELSVGDTVDVAIGMSPQPLLLDSILVSVRRAGRQVRPVEQLLYGRLLDDSTHDPIAGGTVRLLTSSGSVATSAISSDDGLFWIVSPRPGTYRLEGERIGYETAESPELKLMPGDSIGVDFYLSTQAVLLSPLVVTASRRPWGDRADLRSMESFFTRFSRYAPSGYGEFMTRDSIAEWENRAGSVGTMLLASMPEVLQVVPNSGLIPGGGADPSGSFLGGAVVLRNGRFRNGGALQDHCIPQYYLDGVPVPYTVVSAMMPADLEGVELYMSPNIPSRFLTGWPCGVVAYWSRRSPDGHHSGGPTFITGAIVGVLVAIGALLIR